MDMDDVRSARSEYQDSILALRDARAEYDARPCGETGAWLIAARRDYRETRARYAAARVAAGLSCWELV